MSETLKILLILITLIYLFIIVKAVKKRKMHINYSIFWIFTGIILIISVLIPNFIENISRFLGFEKASNMVFCIAIFILFYLVLNLTHIVSKQYQQIVKLIQEVSMLKSDCNKENNNEDK